jgi:hypothetical protein
MIRERTVYLVLTLSVVLAFGFATNTLSDTDAKKHKKQQARPIKLGTSGGNNKDTNSQFCCSGTLGALVEDAQGIQHVLSNNHVLGRANKGKAGDDVDQPGLIDNNCNPSSLGPVADLSKKVKFKFGGVKLNLVDAAMARVRPGGVDPTGAIIDTGIPGQPEEPALGDAVQKTGRTTGNRKGEVAVVDATFNVPIPDECGSRSTKTARFAEQFIITPNKPSKPFSLGGDSGSLVTANGKPCPAAKGLLAFGDAAGNGGANNIFNVLSKLKVNIVGCTRTQTALQSGIREWSVQDPRIRAAKAIKDRYIDRLMDTPGVSAAGIGFARPGSRELAIHVYIIKGSRAAQRGMVPANLESLPIVRIETDGFKPL